VQKTALLYDDVATALSANFEALKVQEEGARYAVAKTKSAASVPLLAAGGVVAGCFMLHNKLDCGVQCVCACATRARWRLTREQVRGQAGQGCGYG